MASFWKLAFGGGSNNDGLPVGQREEQANMRDTAAESPPPEDQAPAEHASSLPPPPTTNAYTHSPVGRVHPLAAAHHHLTPERSIQRTTVGSGVPSPVKIPEFHIFQPSQQDSEVDENRQESQDAEMPEFHSPLQSIQEFNSDDHPIVGSPGSHVSQPSLQYSSTEKLLESPPALPEFHSPLQSVQESVLEELSDGGVPEIHISQPSVQELESSEPSTDFEYVPEFHISQPSVQQATSLEPVHEENSVVSSILPPSLHKDGTGDQKQSKHPSIPNDSDKELAPHTGKEMESELESDNADAILQDNQAISTSPEPGKEETTALAVVDPRLSFLKESVVPLHILENQASKRRQQSKSRIHNLECRLASLQARLAQEVMDRNVAFKQVMDRSLHQPLAELAEELTQMPVVLQKEHELERRLRVLQGRMVKHAHVTLIQLQREELEAQHDYLVREWHPSLRLESSKVDKREGSLVRKFESLAGNILRQIVEEVATRNAAVTELQEQWRHPPEHKRAMEFLDQLQQLRAQLEAEREERMVQEERTKKLIAERTAALKRAFLEAVGSN